MFGIQRDGDDILYDIISQTIRGKTYEAIKSYWEVIGRLLGGYWEAIEKRSCSANQRVELNKIL